MVEYVKINDSYYSIGFSDLVSVHRIEKPQTYSVVSEEEMSTYPKIKGFIMRVEEKIRETEMENYMRIHRGNSNVSREELVRAAEFVNKYGRQIRYGGEFYEVLVDIDVSLSEYEPPQNCTKFTEKDLKKYPQLKEVVKEASAKGRAYVEIGMPNYRKETGFNETCIKYNGGYYETRIWTSVS
ncbi:MAG: hypothetical protein R6U44_10115 [Archaeoglobaceae archaeon]